MQRALFLIAAAALAAGCAAETSTGGGYVDKQYRTGSHIPGRAPSGDVTSASKDEVDKARDSSLNPGTAMPMPQPGSR